MTVWADPPRSRREARQKVREEAGAANETISEEELASAAAEEAAERGEPAIRRTGSGGRRAQWSPATLTSSFAPASPRQHHEPDDNTDESQADVVPELTMTRRELRALRERVATAGQPAPDIVFLPTGVDTEDRSTASTHPEQFLPEAERDGTGVADEAEVVNPEVIEAEVVDAAVVDADLLEGELVASRTSDPSAEVQDAAAPIPDLIEPPSGDWAFRASRPSVRAEQPAGAASAEPSTVGADGRATADGAAERSASADTELEYIEAELVDETGDSQPPVGGESRDQSEMAAHTDVPETLSPFDAMFRAPSSGSADPQAPTSSTARPATVPAPVTEPGLKPYGHWTTQAALADAAPSIDGFLTRDVGVTTGAITTHALILPSIPESGDQLLAPFTNTGEIMITGSVDLPRTFGSTGAHPARFDHPDVDALIDESDREDAVSASAPVRAIRAVSSTGSTRGVIEAPTKPKSRLPLVAGIVLGGIILVVGAFVAAALIFNVF